MDSLEQVLVQVVEAKAFSTAVIAGALGMAFQSMDYQEAIQFGCVAGTGMSFGDAALGGMGIDKSVGKYLGKDYSPYMSYVDPSDFLGGGAGTALLCYAIGTRGETLMYCAGFGAIAGGIAPYISNSVISYMAFNKMSYADKQGKGNGSK